MKLAVLLSCCALTFGQNTSSAPETNLHNPTSSSEQQQSGQNQATQAAAAQVSADRGRQYGGLDILSDTEGVDFGSYLQRLLQNVRANWYHLIPEAAEQKRGKVAIEFAISKDGKVANMHLAVSSGDAALDRTAWMSITASNPFPPLPSAFTGPYFALRLRFYYNPDKSDLSGPIMKPLSEPAPTNEAADSQCAGLHAGITAQLVQLKTGYTEPAHVQLAFLLVNDSDSTVDVKAGSWKIVIDEVELQDSDLIFGNGPMPTGGWSTLQAGQYYELGKALPISKYFPREGEHKISWKGDGFCSPTITIRIPNNP